MIEDASTQTLEMPQTVPQTTTTTMTRRLVQPHVVEFANVRSAYGKGRKRIKVLDGINVRVPEAAIYALLGPSGCGKTTLCNCITGRHKPTSGSLRVFGRVPGAPGSNVPGPIIGYMPQEISLFPDFTIEETLLYFSKLYRLDPVRASERVNFLVNFLELPQKRRMVAQLSGGQQRRVSLAAALIHSPPLLILDEPTVGVDPVLRQVIWDYLVLLSTKERLSIIITTHYIEEARAANVCGLMRQGRLLVEASPDVLMAKFKCPTLEAVFLQLSRASDSQRSPADVVAGPDHAPQTHCSSADASSAPDDASHKRASPRPEVAPREPAKADEEEHKSSLLMLPNSPPGWAKFERFEMENNDQEACEAKSSSGLARDARRSFDRIGALTSKNFARLMRNWPLLLFQFMLPSVEVILFCLCIGQEPFNLALSVFNEEALRLSSGNETDLAFGSQFLEHIDRHSVRLEHFPSSEAALGAVREGKTWGALTIGDDFTLNLKMRFLEPSSLTDADYATGSVRMHLDMSNYLISLHIQRTILRAFRSFAHEHLARSNLSAQMAELPVRIEEPIYGVREPTFTEFMAPGVLLSIAFLAAVALTAIALVQERKEGVLERSLVAGVTSTEFIMSHVITQLLVLHVQVFLLLIFTFLVFEIPSRGPFFWVVLLTILQSSCGMAFGLMISAMTKEETSATMLALGSFYPNLLLSGTVWPTQAMPDAVRYFAYCLPQTLPIESLRHVLSRGWDITHAEVATGFALTIAWTSFFLIAAVIVFKSQI